MTPSLRQLLDDMMREVCSKTNSSLDFQDFIRMMRQFQDIQTQEKAKKERQAIEDTGFSQDEIKDFKEMFDSSLNIFSGGAVREELSQSDVRNMLCNTGFIAS